VLDRVVEVGVVEELAGEEPQPGLEVGETGAEVGRRRLRRQLCAIGRAEEDARQRFAIGRIVFGCIDEAGAHARLQPTEAALAHDLEPGTQRKRLMREIEAKHRLADVMQECRGIGDHVPLPPLGLLLVLAGLGWAGLESVDCQPASGELAEIDRGVAGDHEQVEAVPEVLVRLGRVEGLVEPRCGLRFRESDVGSEHRFKVARTRGAPLIAVASAVPRDAVSAARPLARDRLADAFVSSAMRPVRTHVGARRLGAVIPPAPTSPSRDADLRRSRSRLLD